MDFEQSPDRIVGTAAVGSGGGRQKKAPVPVKIIVAGGFGVGKTTMVGSVSEIRPLQTEEVLTGAEGADDVSGVETKTTTTVTMDFGRITITEDLQLYLFGTPGQDRFWFLWDELSQGALGAVVLADTRRLADCFPSIDYFEQRGTPFVVAVNTFDGQAAFDLDEVRWALAVNDRVPVVAFDARLRTSVRDALLVVLEQALDDVLRTETEADTGPPVPGAAEPLL